MSRLQRFRVWVGASRQRYALLWAFGTAASVTMIEAMRHHGTAGFRELASTAIEWFVVCYLVSLLFPLPSRFKRPS
jgi:hypothetical protein